MIIKSKAMCPGSERAVLAGLIRYGVDCFIDVSELVNRECFTVDSNQIIYDVLNSIFTKTTIRKVDIPTFLSEANSCGLSDFFKKDSELKYLNSLTNFAIELENILPIAKKVRKLEIARQLQYKSREIYKKLDEVNGTEDVQHILSLAENPIFEMSATLNSTGDNDIIQIGQGIDEEIEHIENHPTDIIGISTGFLNYDLAIGGGVLEDAVHIIGGRAKSGKSSLKICMGLNVACKQKIPVLDLDTELNPKKQRMRMLSVITGIPIKRIVTGKYTDNPIERECLHKAKKMIKDMPYSYRNVAGKPFHEILSVIRRWIIRYVGYDEYGNVKPALILYDYLKLQDSNDLNKMAEFQAIGFNLMQLKNLCIKYKVPCLAWVQLNRDGLTKEDASVASQSDRITWFGDSFSIVKPKSEEEIASDGPSEGNMKLVVVMARDGEGTEDGNYINLQFIKDRTKFVEGKTKFELLKNTKNVTSKQVTPFGDADENIDPEADTPF